MKILVIGSGGREHALCWKFKQSPQCQELFCAPGNPGIAELAQVASIAADDIEALLKFALEKKIDLTFVGPEVPLVLGIVDLFQKNGLKIIGPSKAAAQLEGSKQFAKKMMQQFGVPTANYAVFDSEQLAKEHLFLSRFPIVIKADGLASGKGVLVARMLSEAMKFLKSIFQDQVFAGAPGGSAKPQVVIEDFMSGEEASILAFVDGKNFISMETAQDHKTIFDEDEGPNTGGMGAYSPAPLITTALKKQIDAEVFRPMVSGMAAAGMPYQGILYAGLMITDQGPKVVEFNCRFGDPETQAVLFRLKTDLVEICQAILEQRLDQIDLQWKADPAVCVVMASEGYPGVYKKGKVITGVADAEVDSMVKVFHAGTAQHNTQVVTAGGRVLGVTAIGGTLKDAVKRAYNAVNKIEYEGRYFRKDIAKKAFKHL
jgi:phosphoribosylamine--glycine ligase